MKNELLMSNTKESKKSIGSIAFISQRYSKKSQTLVDITIMGIIDSLSSIISIIENDEDIDREMLSLTILESISKLHILSEDYPKKISKDSASSPFYKQCSYSFQEKLEMIENENVKLKKTVHQLQTDNEDLYNRLVSCISESSKCFYSIKQCVNDVEAENERRDFKGNVKNIRLIKKMEGEKGNDETDLKKGKRNHNRNRLITFSSYNENDFIYTNDKENDTSLNTNANTNPNTNTNANVVKNNNQVNMSKLKIESKEKKFLLSTLESKHDNDKEEDKIEKEKREEEGKKDKKIEYYIEKCRKYKDLIYVLDKENHKLKLKTNVLYEIIQS